MAQNDTAVKLRVQEAYHRDIGTGIARIDIDTMKKLGTMSGDIIEINGRGISSYAVAWTVYPSEEGKRLILIDSNTRAITNVGIDDRVKVKKVLARPAEHIVIAPMQPMRVTADEQYLLRSLRGQAPIHWHHDTRGTARKPYTFHRNVNKPGRRCHP